MKKLSIILCTCAVLWAGCGREEEEEEEEEERKEGRDEATTTQRDEGAGARRDEPRTGAEGAPGSAQEPTGEPTKAEEGSSARRAEADLSGVGDGKIEGKATLEEQGDKGVALTVRLEGAAPGEREVRVYERASCEGLEQKAKQPAPGSSPAMNDLGTVTIGPDGKGVLELKASSATLKPDEQTSLLGKALVVQGKSPNAPPGTARVDTAASDAVACGMIRAPAETKPGDTPSR